MLQDWPISVAGFTMSPCVTPSPTMSSKKIAIITTSTRVIRIGPSVAALVKGILEPAAAEASLELEIVDLKSFNLPLYDEAVPPSSVPKRAQFAHAHSIAWSNAIASYDAYILVIPEYNMGMSGSTKNAIDYLYNEWRGRPAAIVSYGIFGGTGASEQVKGVLSAMKLRLADTRPALAFANDVKGPDLFAAVNEGVLGKESSELWTQGENKRKLLAAFGEIKELLQAAPEVGEDA
ncbi:hypothetical protein jhhlp_008235 [Lomentospora prolificans]|uniref:NADPH-dependent FMN reductase-like domain-containing protein n=1 Tax=Lomentospora prolificans TaxID=41688 RepID=A0A2N3MXG3_9PEZI|nr:hypothetical protein jhhlp_008235 [Lomentospora prolificans]